MTAVVIPAAAPQTDIPQFDAPFAFARVVGTEAFVGLALGLAIRLLVMALQVAGTIAAQATSLSQFFGGAGAEPQPAISQILMLGGIALLMLAGFPERAAEYLILSYSLLPAGDWPDPAAMADWGSGRVARAFALGFSLSTPFLIGSVLYNLALGAINRAMPTLMVAFVGAPAMTVAALGLLALASPQLLHHWLILADAVLADPAAP
jgi:flagellar biosynthetic protein FliR